MKSNVFSHLRIVVPSESEAAQRKFHLFGVNFLSRLRPASRCYASGLLLDRSALECYQRCIAFRHTALHEARLHSVARRTHFTALRASHRSLSAVR